MVEARAPVPMLTIPRRRYVGATRGSLTAARLEQGSMLLSVLKQHRSMGADGAALLEDAAVRDQERDLERLQGLDLPGKPAEGRERTGAAASEAAPLSLIADLDGSSFVGDTEAGTGCDSAALRLVSLSSSLRWVARQLQALEHARLGAATANSALPPPLRRVFQSWSEKCGLLGTKCLAAVRVEARHACYHYISRAFAELRAGGACVRGVVVGAGRDGLAPPPPCTTQPALAPQLRGGCHDCRRPRARGTA